MKLSIHLINCTKYLAVLSISSSGLISQSNTWEEKADFIGSTRSEAVGFSIGAKGYIGTGRNLSGYQKDFWEYDPSTNIWTQKADFGGTARFQATGFSIGSKGYLGTGVDGSGVRKDFWEYDPSNNSWIQKADFGSDRVGAVGFSIGTKGYLGTGSGSGSSYKKDFWEYDPTDNSWSQKADIGGSIRILAVGFAIGGKGYIGTGHSDLARTTDFWEYNPATDIWIQKADFGGTARYAATGFSIGNKGYIGTGDDLNSEYKNDFWEYDPSIDTWIQKADAGNTTRYLAVGFSIGNKGYIGTGITPILQDFLEYTGLVPILDSDCDGVTDSIDVCPGGNDKVDNDHDGRPDCKFAPNYSSIISDWKPANNQVYICHFSINLYNPCVKRLPPSIWPGQTIQVPYSSISERIKKGDYLGPCGSANCCGLRH